MIRRTRAMPSSLPHLDAVPLFSCLNPAERALLSPLCTVRPCARGEELFREGEPARALFFVILGRVKVVKAAHGRDVIVGIFGPGEPVGVLAAFEEKTFPATAAALEPSTVLEVPAQEFFALVDAHPEMTRRLLQGLIVRQLEVTRRLADQSGSVEYRAARLFLTLAERAGTRAGEGAEIPIALTRQEIADLCGTTVETAIRTMSRWGKEGLVLTRPDGFSIPDVGALRRLAAG
ncbi:Crp/Fnr family transcriptional regulator [Acidobacteria bacterium ACD]|nr:MAG: Crp/Fnr family transcriptional regulator [Acidobacteriota bacterium]MCE7957022.1 Crp/Fnr family transcriptional regulator [Acidobacteria bacterium ACB2]MDL1951641.1 Crp/Fnr family transcriptional regulator [Acidobacteria bacterium ACD]